MQLSNKLWTRGFYLMCGSNLLLSVSFYFLLPTLPVFIMDVLQVSKVHVGFIFASYTLSALLIRPFTGFFLDSYGRKFIFLISFFVFAVLFGAYALVFTVFQLLILRFMHGLSWGVTTTSFSTAIVDIIPANRRGEGLGLFGLFMTVGMAIGPLLGIAIVGDNHYDRMFIVSAILAVGGFVMASIVKYPEFKADSLSRQFAWHKLLAPSAIPVSLIVLLVCFTYGGVIVFISLYARETGIENSGIFFIIYAIGLGISRLFSGKIFDKHGPEKISFVGLTAMIIGLLTLALLKNYIGFITSAFLLGVGFGIVFPTFQAMVNHTVSMQQRGAANSTFFTAVDLGIGLGAVVTGLLSGYISLTTTFILCALITFIATILFYAYALKQFKLQILKIENIEFSKQIEDNL